MLTPSPPAQHRLGARDNPVGLIRGSWLAWSALRADAPAIGLPAVGNHPAPAGTWDQIADAYLFPDPRDKLTQGGEAFDL